MTKEIPQHTPDKKKLLKSQIFHLSKNLHKTLNEKQENKHITSKNSEGGGFRHFYKKSRNFLVKGRLFEIFLDFLQKYQGKHNILRSSIVSMV